MLHVLLYTALLLGQSDAAASDLSSQVKELVRELDAPSLARREAAQQKLLELGPRALEFLPETNNRMPAELKQRLGQVRNRLQREEAEASVRASQVTLAGEMPLSEILAEFEKQTGNPISDYREQAGQQAFDPKLTVKFDKTDFWKALDEVLDKAELTLYPFADTEGLAVVSRMEQELPRSQRSAAYAGAFRVEPVEFLASRNLRYPENGRLQLDLEIAWEPRLRPISLQQPLEEVQAVGEDGQQIEVQAAEAVLEAPVHPDDRAIELSLPFSLPQRSTKKIASLKGKLLAMVPSQIETFRFEDLAQGPVERRKGGVTVLLERVRKNGDVWEVRVLVRFDETLGALESHRGWVFNNEAYLESPEGERINYDGMEVTRQPASGEEVGMAYYFDLEQGPQGLTFVYKTPTMITVLPVEYELKDLELP